eukprot:CAMPEP_0115000962 /NCGR_PEP_ID=MMETSP0216-20121206/17080_1 /TAXON_ID=223996 /ORGANISM="Protocruzia adherens, Strain Boccale" /LENGTH=38 /DNA_ID= /DNA_START= /DNA_END= /DNA_ORIENTATION=
MNSCYRAIPGLIGLYWGLLACVLTNLAFSKKDKVTKVA